MPLSLLLRCARWVHNTVRNKVRNAVLKVLAAGPMPRHIAFVMDGNRRYARSHQLKVQQGHSEGFVALQRVLELCLRLRIHCVTAYAFAIDNFKRTPDEVDALMELAEAKLMQMCEHGELLHRYGVRLNVLGRVELFPPRVREAVRKAEELTKDNDRAVLNLCMPYASRDEIAQAVERAVRDTTDGKLRPEEITERVIENHLMTSYSRSGSPPLDILIRTSGVKRLSDFLLWQCHSGTQLQFTPAYWPDFGLRELAPILLDFQRKIWADKLAGRVAPSSGLSRVSLIDDEAERMWSARGDMR